MSGGGTDLRNDPATAIAEIAVQQAWPRSHLALTWRDYQLPRDGQPYSIKAILRPADGGPWQRYPRAIPDRKHDCLIGSVPVDAKLVVRRSYHVIVREHEYHPGWAYVGVLVADLRWEIIGWISGERARALAELSDGCSRCSVGSPGLPGYWICPGKLSRS